MSLKYVDGAGHVRLALECDASRFLQAVELARDAIIATRLWQPQVAIVLGSGLGELAGCVQHASVVPYRSIPYFPQTSAAGHEGKLILGYLAGLPIILMQGRSHRYEGYSNSEVSFPVHCMQALGAHTLITTNAAGGLNTRFQTGDLMVLDSHIDFLWPRRMFHQSPSAGNGVRGRNPYDHELINRVKAIARQRDISLHQGCYLGTLGPTYETRSEYRMFRQTGADAVGMSTIPEVLAARDLAMRVLAFSVITPVASTDAPVSTTHAEVVDSGTAAGPKLLKIIQQLLEEMSGQPD